MSAGPRPISLTDCRTPQNLPERLPPPSADKQLRQTAPRPVTPSMALSYAAKHCREARAPKQLPTEMDPRFGV